MICRIGFFCLTSLRLGLHIQALAPDFTREKHPSWHAAAMNLRILPLWTTRTDDDAQKRRSVCDEVRLLSKFTTLSSRLWQFLNGASWSQRRLRVCVLLSRALAFKLNKRPLILSNEGGCISLPSRVFMHDHQGIDRNPSPHSPCFCLSAVSLLDLLRIGLIKTDGEKEKTGVNANGIEYNRRRCCQVVVVLLLLLLVLWLLFCDRVHRDTAQVPGRGIRPSNLACPLTLSLSP